MVVPARDEEAVVGRCLETLRVGVPQDAFELVVVCNGCSDRTAGVARAHGARVLETSRAGKAHALNLGDAAVTTFPRFYVDADVEVTGGALAAVADVLRSGQALAASPRPRFDLRGASMASRAYHAIWTRLPYVRESHVGSGAIGLSEAGRRRFDRFPDAIADDFFVYHLFAPHERQTVESCSHTVRAPRTARALVRRKSRVRAGNAQARRLGLVPSSASRPRRAAWLGVVARHPWLLPAAPVYAAISFASALGAWRKTREGALHVWERDETSRREQAVWP